jgi:Fe-S-cluster-containing dehydrogenase component/formate-dependent nitrite reductase membrane component NrfD
MRGARPETPSLEEGVAVRDSAPVLWAKVIDHRKCIGCHACTLACKAEHLVPLGVNRTYVKQVEVGGFPAVQRHFQITRCNQCDDPPCVHICPTGAMFRRRDGIVDFDRSICIGCKACMAACPYDAIYIDPVSKSAEKCNFCAHRIDMGLEPACVVVCPVEAIVVGPLNGDGSEVREILTREHVTVRKPEKGTRPKLFYIDGHDATLVPGAAAHPPLYAFAENPNRAHASLSLGAAPQGMVDPNLLQEVATYEAPGKPPWGWMVSAYLWTKSLAAGFFLLPALLAWIGAPLGRPWELALTALAAFWLAVTGMLLVGDLTHPERFYLILLRPRWRSWLSRGAVIITAYGALLGASLLATFWEWEGVIPSLRVGGAVLASLTAIYTAFLFAQARGRDLWQNPFLPLHLLVQALLAGSAATVVLLASWPGREEVLLPVLKVLLASLVLHLFAAAGDLFVPHATADAALAARSLYRGSFRLPFWAGLLGGSLLPLALLAGNLSGGRLVLAAAGVLVGLLLYDHAYVQAGQSVPLR